MQIIERIADDEDDDDDKPEEDDSKKDVRSFGWLWDAMYPQEVWFI